MDWNLSNCCHTEQIIVISVVIAWSAVILALWNFNYILLPFKLLTVFLHEFGHASAAWLTGGKVNEIVVNTNQGGHVVTQGGNQFIILSSGYLGSCLWGLIILIMASFSIITMRIMTGILISILLAVLFYFAGNWTIRMLAIGFILYFSFAWFLTEYFRTVWPLRVVLIQVGTMSSLYSIWDIYSDLLVRTVKNSDSYKIAQLTGCNAKFCGFLWAVLAISLLTFACYLLLVLDNVGLNGFN